MATTEEKVMEILSEELCIPIEDIALESRIIEDMEADSLDQVELIMSFEEQFGIEFPETEVATLKTVAEVIEYMNKRVGE